MRRISNTFSGQTGTQSALPSQRLKSTMGTMTPGSCLHLAAAAGRWPRLLMLAPAAAAAAQPAHAVLEFGALFFAHLFPAMAMVAAVPAAASAHAAEQDAAQDQQADSVQIIELMDAVDQRRHQPVPQRHDDPAQRADADDHQQRDFQYFPFHVHSVLHYQSNS